MRFAFSRGTTVSLVCCLLAVAPIVAPIAGCFRPHLTQPVEIKVFDAITGEHVAGASVVHGAPTGKFERSLRENATADAAGVATIDSLRFVTQSRTDTIEDRHNAHDAEKGKVPSMIPEAPNLICRIWK